MCHSGCNNLCIVLLLLTIEKKLEKLDSLWYYLKIHVLYLGSFFLSFLFSYFFLAKQLRVNGYLKNFANLSRNKSHTSHLPSTQTWSEPERQRVPSRSLGDNLAMISLPSARQMRAHGLSGSSIASHVYLLPRYSLPLKALHCSFL